MADVFGPKTVPGSIRSELTARAGKAGMLWASKRYPWMDFRSFSSGCGETLSSLKGGALYDGASKRPNPIVTEVNIKKQGEFGTTLSGEVKFIAFTDEQLLKLTTCYFIPGMSVRAQWGWSLSATGASAPSILTGPMPDEQAICQMNSLAGSSTCYSGLQGRVTKFSYTLNSDNAWDCSVEFTAATEALGGIHVAEYSCDCAREIEEKGADGKAQKVVKRMSSLRTLCQDLQDKFSSAVSAYGPGLTQFMAQTNRNPVMSRMNILCPQRDETGTETTSFFEDITPDFINKPDSNEPYISFGTLEAAINVMAVASQDGKYVQGKLDSPNTKLAYHPDIQSSDPRICFIPGARHIITNGLNSGALPPSAIEGGHVILDNIMISCVWLGTELKAVEEGYGNLKTFIQNVLRKINDTCGNLWELDTVNNGLACQSPQLTIIDTKVFKGAGIFEIPGTGAASAIRELKLDLKMADSMKTQAVFGNGVQTSSPTPAGGSCGGNQFSGWGLAVNGNGSPLFKDLANPRAATPPPCLCSGVAGQKEKTVSEAFKDLQNTVNDGNASVAKAALMRAIGDSVKNGDDSHCKGMPLPFECSITLDGIGGFAWGQMVTCDRIPARTREAFSPQVTAVEHHVTAQDWTTTINLLMRYK
jgi:hypothetical protein